MKTIVSFLFLVFAGFVSLAAAAEKGAIPEVARKISEKKLPSEQKDQPAKFKIDITPTYGNGGSPRPATFIEGEALTFWFSVAKISDRDNFEAGLVFTILDAEGNSVGQSYRYFLTQEELQFGGAMVSSYSYFESPKMGKYRLQLKVINISNGENEIKELPFEVLPKDTFGATNLRFSQDAKGISPSSGNLTIGESRGLYASINGLGTQGNRIHIKSTFSTLDRNKQVVKKKTFEFNDEIPPGGPSAHFYFAGNQPGSFYVRLEIQDCIKNQTVTYELPIKVSLPPGMEDEKP